MEEELRIAIEAFRSGNEDAFHTIYKLSYNKILFIANQHARNLQEAEDILQETFVSIYRSLPKLDNVDHYNAWINKIVHNYFLKSVRSKQVSMRVDMGENYDFDQFVPSAATENPKKQYYEDELKTLVEEAMSSLSTEQQDVVRLRFYDEFSVKEIADILNIPEGTVKSRINTVRNLLKPRLEVHRNMLGASTVPLIALYFKDLIAHQAFISDDEVSKRVKDVKAKAVKNNSTLFKRMRPNFGILVTTSILAVIPMTLLLTQKDTSFEGIDYNKDWTNQNINIEIKGNLSSTNKLEFFLNDTLLTQNAGDLRTVAVSNNGLFSVRHQGETLFNHAITNIDKEVPSLTIEDTDTELKVLLQDNLSGLDLKSLVVIDDMKNDINYEMVDNIIHISKEHKYPVIYIEVSDLAGNIQKSTIELTTTSLEQ